MFRLIPACRWRALLACGLALLLGSVRAMAEGDAVAGGTHRMAEPAAAADDGEKEQLRQRVAQLEVQLADVTLVLAETRAELDRLHVQQEQITANMDATETRLGQERTAEVLDVNRDLGLVVINHGSVDGLKPGMVLAVIRGDQVLARVRVVDVRGSISAARVESMTETQEPAAGDRVTVWRTSR